MKPLNHPDIKDVTVEGILYALGDPVRVQIFAEIAKADCPKICASFINVQGRELAKSTLSQHFNVLRNAGLIRSERKGVQLENVTRCAELKERFGTLIGSIIEAYAVQASQEAASQETK